ncbi:MAG: hypothetical protein LKH74_10865 [Levilactobacillus sp.]|jgi:hypothetical protein|uniref:Uncharacterized protein n=1 Tax=Levilactobacillus suantsaiihabitans TaxID=2487722 RepID=A0A4Z0J9V5_9LACO|nr:MULTISPECIES: hypothetical protein [Levilactobacillus]MCI1554410.1 hypothetical protein [Levilactobacillus sp.]MCI1598259.1 hypothetical protein [Levilactobacillus sp.]TGD19121.1 hypothetical protein EGT51_05730 [Levilactobacillus suantsaiihabitans]
MTQVRYPTTPLKIGVTILTVVMLLAMLLVPNPVVVAFLCFSSLITAMIHFNVFESSADTNPLNRIDLAIQVIYLVASVAKAFIIGGHA